MIKQSIWLNENKTSNFEVLHTNIETNVLIIGGGIVGILCAYELSQRNINYVLVEQDKIGLHTSTKSTAFLSIQHDTLYQDLIKNHGIKKAKQYLELNIKALRKYKELSKKYSFDYEEYSSSIYTNKDKEKIYKEQKALEKLNYKSTIIKDLPLDINAIVGLSIPKQAVINPYKLIINISKDLNIYEHTCIKKLTKNKAITENNNTIIFDKVIIATHYPIKNVKNLLFTKLTQRRSYVCSIKTTKRITGTYNSIDEDGFYFRQYQDNIIIGGNDRDTGDIKNNTFYEKVKQLNIGEITNIWSGQDCITLDNIPYIGKLSYFNNNHLVATGFNLFGYTWAMASSFILADIIEWNQEYKLVDPRRIVLNKKLLYNIKTSIINLLKFKKIRCKHLGCSLMYNEAEKTWECPCHGSRYSYSGKVLDGPTKKNIAYIHKKNKKNDII